MLGRKVRPRRAASAAPDRAFAAAVDEAADAQSATEGPGSTGRHFVINALGTLFLPAVALVTAPILAYTLGVDGRGQVAAASAPYLLMSVFGALGIPDAVTYFVARRAISLRTITVGLVGVSLALGVVGALAIWLFAPWLAGGDPGLTELVRVAAVPLPVYLCVGVARGWAAGVNRWGLVAGEQAIFAATRLVAIVGLAATGNLHVLQATIIFVVTPVLGALAYLPLLRSNFQYEPKAGEAKPLREVMGYGLRTWIGAIAGVLLYRLDQTLMTPLSDTEQLGLYVVAVTIGELPSLVTNSVQNVTLAKESKNPSLSSLATISRVATLASSLVALGLAVVSPWLIPILFGRDFGPAVPVAVILMASAVFGAAGAVAGAGLAGRGRPGLRSVALAVACLVNAALIVALVPPFGAIGAALAMVGGTSSTAAVNILLLRHHYGARPVDFVGVRKSDITMMVGVVRGLAAKVRRRP